MRIEVTNQSTLVTDFDVRAMCNAVSIQLRLHVSPAWNRHPIGVTFTKDPKSAPPGSTVIAVLDDSDQAGALGWHTETAGGVTFGRVFARPVLENGGDALKKPLSVASVVSHEVCEAFCDANVNLWADDGNGKLYAVEVCDPVEADSYPINNVTVSNFTLPAWYDSQADPAGPFDHLRNLKAPFTMTPRGYVVYRQGGSEHQTFGDKYPAFKMAWKASPLSRTAHRMRAA